jgi:hypothetical protein
MVAAILCGLGFHVWDYPFYTKSDGKKRLFRFCKRCGKEEYFYYEWEDDDEA